MAVPPQKQSQQQQQQQQQQRRELPKLQLPLTCDPPSEENPPQPRVWVIFGATGQMGRSLVRRALHHNDCVTAVGRMLESTPAEMTKLFRNHPLLLALTCDVRIRPTVEEVVQTSVKHWGKVEVVANCTGHAIITPAEDAPSSELAAQFATNVHGTLHILQSTLPYFRTRRIPGRYLIFSSTAGALGIPGLAPYCATKYAVEGLVESMLYEVNVWGIKATLVEPGFVRDDDDDDDDEVDPSPRDPTVDAPSSPSNTAATPYAHFTLRASPSPPYTHPTHPTHHATRILSWLGPAGQPTSSSRSAELVWQLAHCRYPPLRLLLGAYAVDSVRDRLRCVTEEIEDWKGLRFGEGAPGAGSGGAGQVEEASGEGGTEDNEGDGGETYEQGPSSTRASFAEPGGAGPSSQTSPRSVHFGGSERSSSFGGAGHAAGEGRRKDSGVTEGSMG